MSETHPSAVHELVDSVPDATRRRDTAALIDLMTQVTGDDPRVWSAGTVGFGRYHYRYETGQEGEFFRVGLAPRKDRITLYIMSGLRGFEDILERLGPHTSGKSTVHIKSMDRIDKQALTDLVSECVRHLEAVEEAVGAIPRMDDIPPRNP